MVNSHAHEPVLAGETLYEIITNWAARADTFMLGAATVLFPLGAVTTVQLNNQLWPLAAIFATAAAICIWGAVEQLIPRPHGRLVVALEWILVAIGCVAALSAALGVLFLILGPAPIL